MIDRKRLVQTLVGVYGFYDRELTEFAIRIWSDALSGIEMATVEEAFAGHLRDTEAGRFLPKPADILRQIKGSAEDAALVAWGDVLNRARAGGGSNGLPEPARRAVEAMGGWSVICRSQEDQLGFLQRRFVDMYRAYRGREEQAALAGAAVLKLTSGKD
jgi:hypothetical protein